MTKDLTEGRPMGLILRFCIPLVLGNLFQQLYNMVDTIIVGQYLGLDALTSVGATGAVMFLILGFCMGVCSGLAVPVAQQFGAKQYGTMREYIMNAAYLAVVMAAILTAATCLLCENILTWMGTQEQFMADAYDYLFVIFLGIPCTFLYNTVSGIIRAMGDSKTPFYFLVLSAVLNIFLDLLFIITFGWGTAGAAWATILSQLVSGVLCFFYMRRRFTVLQFSASERRLRMGHVRTLLVMGVPMGLQFSITAIGSIMLQAAVNSLQAVYVSAYAAALKVNQLAMSPYDGIANATATFGSQNLGAKKLKRVRQGLKSGIIIALLYCLIISIVLITAGSKIALLFVSAEEVEVLTYAQQFLTVAGICYFFLAFLNVTRMTIQGLGHSGIAMLAGCWELVARAVMSVAVIPLLGWRGVCITSPLAWAAAVAWVMPVFFRIMRKLERQQADAC